MIWDWPPDDDYTVPRVVVELDIVAPVDIGPLIGPDKLLAAVQRVAAGEWQARWVTRQSYLTRDAAVELLQGRRQDPRLVVGRYEYDETDWEPLTIYDLDTEEVDRMIDLLTAARSAGTQARIAVDDEGVMIKVGGGAWSPPMGEPEDST